MTKEELKKEAVQYAVDYPTSYGKGYKRKDLRTAYIAGAELREKQIAELEKENAELKGIKDVATLIRANNDTVTTLMQLNNMLVSRNQQLTKAKEIIKELLNLPFASDEEVFADVSTILGKAEQFLIGVEK